MQLMYSMNIKIVLLLNFIVIISNKIDCSGSFWQITDIHWDLLYDKYGDNTNMCHKIVDKLNSANKSLGYYGDYLCDSPYNLVNSAIHAMKNISPYPEFILWTGDNPPHTKGLNFEIVFETVKSISGKIDSLFQSEVKLIPVLGNHDAFPKNKFPAKQGEFYKRYLTEGGWANLLNAEAQKSFEKGGYFAVDVKFGVKVLVLNTNLYYRENSLGTKLEDPCGQFKWIENQFSFSRHENKKVIVAAHAPPGFWERNPVRSFFNDTYNDRYIDLLNKHGDLIMAQIYGHEHTDSFRIFHDEHSLKSVAFLAPSVTPWFPFFIPGGTAINPSLRLYDYDSSKIIDVWQYHMNLTEANENLFENAEMTEMASKLWKLYYKTTKAYDLPSLSLENAFQWSLKLIHNDTLFQEYFKRNSAGIEHGYCNETCKIKHLCAINYQKIDAVKTCLNNMKELDFNIENIAPKLVKKHLDGPVSNSTARVYSTVSFFSIIALVFGLTLFFVVQKDGNLCPSSGSRGRNSYALLRTEE